MGGNCGTFALALAFILKDKGFDVKNLARNMEKYGDYTLKLNLVGGTPFYFLSKETTSDIIYLRPETAQGIFVNFLNVSIYTDHKN